MTTAMRACLACQTPLPEEAHFCFQCGAVTPTEEGVPPRAAATSTRQIERVRQALASRGYTIERVLGEGGMATVYLATDGKHRRQVAVKVMRPELAATVGAERFLREVEIAAQLTHPHILPVHDSGEVDGVLYYVMPFVEGESLHDRIKRETQLPVEEALRIAREVSEALAYAHGKRIVHRDIKPGNIMLSAGHALVADFGIARAVDARGGSITGTGLAVGTPQYMSPEQASGSSNIDIRSDIYALGAVLYEMLTGETPFTGPNAQAIIIRLLTETPRALSTSRAGIPAEVEALVQRSLVKNPADRWQSTAEFANALRGAEDQLRLGPISGVRTPAPMPAVATGRSARKLWFSFGLGGRGRRGAAVRIGVPGVGGRIDQGVGHPARGASVREPRGRGRQLLRRRRRRPGPGQADERGRLPDHRADQLRSIPGVEEDAPGNRPGAGRGFPAHLDRDVGQVGRRQGTDPGDSGAHRRENRSGHLAAELRCGAHRHLPGPGLDREPGRRGAQRGARTGGSGATRRAADAESRSVRLVPEGESSHQQLAGGPPEDNRLLPAGRGARFDLCRGVGSACVQPLATLLQQHTVTGNRRRGQERCGSCHEAGAADRGVTGGELSLQAAGRQRCHRRHRRRNGRSPACAEQRVDAPAGGQARDDPGPVAGGAGSRRGGGPPRSQGDPDQVLAGARADPDAEVSRGDQGVGRNPGRVPIAERPRVPGPGQPDAGRPLLCAPPDRDHASLDITGGAGGLPRSLLRPLLDPGSARSEGAAGPRPGEVRRRSGGLEPHDDAASLSSGENGRWLAPGPTPPGWSSRGSWRACPTTRSGISTWGTPTPSWATRRRQSPPPSGATA